MLAGMAVAGSNTRLPFFSSHTLYTFLFFESTVCRCIRASSREYQPQLIPLGTLGRITAIRWACFLLAVVVVELMRSPFLTLISHRRRFARTLDGRPIPRRRCSRRFLLRPFLPPGALAEERQRVLEDDLVD